MFVLASIYTGYDSHYHNLNHFHNVCPCNLLKINAIAMSNSSIMVHTLG